MPNGISAAAEMGIGEAAVTAVFGYLVVFCGLLLLMIVLYIMGAVFRAKAKKDEASKAAAPAEMPATVKETAPEQPLAPGSAGHVKLYDVPDKEAAMVMAVVAYKMQKPLNELRFISIKEVKEDEV
ncbi:OadG family protein [uncultured Ruminococcus sp.]|uniref:OadG family protein n=1 Tax=uncultured Ruminococcus sp. TaxID=165186 RepID=UPI00262D29A6|nr:OadG family protein [uncultured Ruminococcus sp.]